MTPYYEDASLTIYHGDSLEMLRGLPDASVDSVVTDPPYGLSFMGKKWDYDVPAVEVWAECLRVLKPGGHLLAFAGTRTQHRMACRIEDAGFEIRDMIAWVYGSGFPKSLDVSKAIDSAAGAEREVIGKSNRHNSRAFGTGEGDFTFGTHSGGVPDLTAPATDAAKTWEGWGTALKPALEPLTLARKPLGYKGVKMTVAQNVQAFGTGGLNIDGCRVETADKYSYPNGPGGKSLHYSSDGRSAEVRPNPTESNLLGRWPANLIHDGSPEVVRLFPDVKTGNVKPYIAFVNSETNFMSGTSERTGCHQGDSGSAARFFYCAKASQVDRDEGLEALSRASAGEMTGGRAEGSAGLQNPRAGAGRTSGGKNIHPTVKPTALMQYLCRLITPPGGVVLDPFMGSGSTGKGALLEGFRFLGVEREADYMEIAKARILSAHKAAVAMRHVDVQEKMAL